MISADEILAEFGVEVVARNVAPRPGQTRAVATVRRNVCGVIPFNPASESACRS